MQNLRMPKTRPIVASMMRVSFSHSMRKLLNSACTRISDSATAQQLAKSLEFIINSSEVNRGFRCFPDPCGHLPVILHSLRDMRKATGTPCVFDLVCVASGRQLLHRTGVASLLIQFSNLIRIPWTCLTRTTTYHIITVHCYCLLLAVCGARVGIAAM